MKQPLFVLFCAICLIFTSFFITSTNASFNDVEHSNFVMKTCENFEETDQHCQPKKWDRSHLKLIDQTIIEGTVCAPQKLSMSLKNIGQPIAHSEWKWELHKVESVQMPLQDGHVIEKGAIQSLSSEETTTVTAVKAKTNGIYLFKIYYPKGFGGSEKPFFTSQHMQLSNCQEKAS
ncbi:amyloid fiber anchoring/assembly protein TapA [Bacillus altitudinis]|jgi:TasA anchoring/assembly protein|uniref:amyloid fiber anchoring/assembly protein TapA n=1 Tax=Bacillus altitudinis TaxID=293387 RepID=UPI00228291CE|nr:amyloid fiber anchoring/assembly protein TapA [Bacillus altitudinis]MCY7440936.1 amyloid fiber anchoring/assembly protein TapA [Bacillus altitudinis]MEC1144779.1 amyloid fiber anchoring/assembly protein TapA [Bacillus altitudinis]MED1423656.1 amyloid fiber anchoring/assembly protein TapA [Bacillus altitudinis]